MTASDNAEQAAFLETLAAHKDRRDGLPMMGLEIEFHVFRDGRHVDFRSLIRKLIRLEDPEPWHHDYYGWIIGTGAKLSADRSYAEIATAPEPMDAEGLRDLGNSVIANRNHLLELLHRHQKVSGGNWRLEGYSTHFNFESRRAHTRNLCQLLATTALPAYMLLTERAISGGMMVRPRPRRVEICGEYIPDPSYQRAVLLYFAATYRAITKTLNEDRIHELPFRVRTGMIKRAKQRSGYSYGRGSYGGYLYRRKRQAPLWVYRLGDSSRKVSAQEVLQTWWEFAAEDLEEIGTHEDLALLEAIVSGGHPLSIEQSRPDTRYYCVCSEPVNPRPGAIARIYGAATQQRLAGSLWVDAERISWRGIRYRLWDGAAPVQVYVPRAEMRSFEAALEDGAVRDLIDRHTPTGDRPRTTLDLDLNSSRSPMAIQASVSDNPITNPPLSKKPPPPPPKKPPKKKPPVKKKEKKKSRCTAACTVIVEDDRPGQRRVKIYIPITSDPLKPPVEKPPPLNAAVGAHNIYLHNGAFFDAAEDMQTRSRGLDFHFMRAYRSDVEYDGVMGREMDHNYNKRIVPAPGPSICDEPVFEEIYDERGGTRGGPIDYMPGNATRETYAFNRWEWRTVKFCEGEFEAVVTNYQMLPGERFLLQRYAVVGGDPPFGGDPIFYIWRNYGGTRMVFNCYGYVTHIIDENDNTMRFHYGAPKNPSTGYKVLRWIVDTANRTYELRYRNIQGTPRVGTLIDFRDPGPRTVVFDYSHIAELTEVHGPHGETIDAGGQRSPQPVVRKYAYDAESRLEKIYRASEAATNGGPVVENTYRADGRIIRQKWGGTAQGAPEAGGTYTITYNGGAVSSIKDRRDTEIKYRLISIHGRRVIERMRVINKPIPYHGVQLSNPAPHYDLAVDHDANYQAIKITHPGGLVEGYEYQQFSLPVTMGDVREWVEAAVTYEDNLARGNLLRKTVRSPRANDPVKTWRWRYDPLFNVPTHAVDEANRTQVFLYNHGWCATPQNNANPWLVLWPSRTLPGGTRVVMFEHFTYTIGGLVEDYTDSAGMVTHGEYTEEGYLKASIRDFGGFNIRRDYEPDDRGNTLEETNPRRKMTKRKYDDRDRLLETEMALGNKTYVEYDREDRPKKIFDQEVDQGALPQGLPRQPDHTEVTEYVYDILGEVVKRINDAGGLRTQTSYAYDGEGNLIKTIEPNGHAGEPRSRVEWVYDVRSLEVIETRCPDGGAQTYPSASIRQTIYGRASFPIAEIDPAGRVTRFRPDGFGFVREIRDHAGNVVRRIPTVDGRVARTIGLGPASGPTPTNATGQSNRILSITDFKYDEYGNVITRIAYAFNRAQLTTVRTLQTDYWYNNWHNLVFTLFPDGSLSSNRYDTAGRTQLHTDRAGGTVEIERDANGNIEKERVTNAPDTDHLMQRPVARIVETRHKYDDLDREIETTNQLGQSAEYGFNSRGRHRWSKSPAGHLSEYRYDGLGRQTDVYKHNAYTVAGLVPLHIERRYDASGNILAYVDGENNETTYQYDCFNRVHRRIDPDLPYRHSIYYYMVDDRLRWVRKRSRIAIRHDYDRIGRLSGRTVANPGSMRGTRVQSYEYDGAGDITKAVDDNGAGETSTVVRTLDSLGRILTESINARERSFAYGAESFPREFVYGSGSRLSWRADTAGRLKRVLLDGNELAVMSYESLDRASERRFTVRLTHQPQAGGPTNNYAMPLVKRMVYDRLNRPQYAVEWAHFPAGPRAFINPGIFEYSTDGFLGTSADPNTKRKYLYDGPGRAFYSDVQDTGGQNPVRRKKTTTFFDGAGNPKLVGIDEERRVGPRFQTTINSDFSQSNQLRSRSTVTRDVASGQPATTQTDSYSYTSMGHLQESRVTPAESGAGLRILNYDAFDRLIRAYFYPDHRRNGVLLTFEYDAFDRRTKTILYRIVPRHQLRFRSHIRHYYFQGRVIEETRSFISETTPGVYARRYFWGDGGLLGVDVLEWASAGTDLDRDGDADDWVAYHYHSDYQGNLVALSRRNWKRGPGQNTVIRVPDEFYDYGAGAGVRVYEVDASGSLLPAKPISRTGQPFYYHGSHYDQAVYLQSFGSRPFDPDTGRFASHDPLGSWADPLSLGNGYVFAGSNPANFTDRSGLYVESIFDAASLGFGAYSISQWNDKTAWYDKALDVFGVAIDAVALALPFIPGGVGAGLRAYRAARTIAGATDVLTQANRVSDAMRLLNTGKQIQRGINIAQGINMGMHSARAYSRYLESGSMWDAGLTLLAGFGAGRSLSQGLRGVCFVAGTVVLTRSGPKAIEEIEMGEEVRAWSAAGGATWAPVVSLQRRHTEALRRIVFENGGRRSPLETTDDHPIWCIDMDAWCPASELEPGARVRVLDGEAAVIENEPLRDCPATDVFNLELAGDHGYFVGDLLVLVHNECLYEYVYTHLLKTQNDVVTDIGAIIAKNADEALEILADPALAKQYKGQAWVRHFLNQMIPDDPKWTQPGMGEVWRRIVIGNALQQVVDRRLPYQTIRKLAGSRLIANKGYVRGAGKALLRPDWRIEIAKSRFAVFDLSTMEMWAKITKYGQKVKGGDGARWLMAISYEAPSALL